MTWRYNAFRARFSSSRRFAHRHALAHHPGSHRSHPHRLQPQERRDQRRQGLPEQGLGGWYLDNNGVKWCKVAWRNNSAHTNSHKLYLWLRSTAAVFGAQRPRPHRILRVSEGPSILAWPTLNMVKNYRGRIWSEATKDCPDFSGFLRANRY